MYKPNPEGGDPLFTIEAHLANDATAVIRYSIPQIGFVYMYDMRHPYPDPPTDPPTHFDCPSDYTGTYPTDAGYDVWKAGAEFCPADVTWSGDCGLCHDIPASERASPETVKQAKVGAVALDEPNFMKKGFHYIMAIAAWVRAGMPERTQEDAAKLEAICRTNACQSYNGATNACMACGCPVASDRWAVRSKTKMATESCPKGLWPS